MMALVELYGSPANAAFVVVSDSNYMSYALWERSPYGSGSYGSSNRYDDSQNFVSQHLVTHVDSYGSSPLGEASLQTLYDTRNGSFGSGSFNSGLSTTSYTYADGISGADMGSSDVLVYQFQTDGWWSTGRVTFTRSNDTALWDTDPVVSDSGGSYGSPLTMSDFTFYNGSDAQMMFGGGSGYYANVSYGSYGGSYSNYISTDDWENNLYQDRYNNLFIASGTGSIPHKQDSVVYEGMGSYSYAPSGTLTQDQMVLDAVGRSFAESGGSGSGSGSGSYGGGSGSYGGGSGAMVVDLELWWWIR